MSTPTKTFRLACVFSAFFAVPGLAQARPCVPAGTDPIACGETVDCALPDTLGEHRYRFSAEVGEVVLITIGSDTCTACWELFDGKEQAVGDKVCLPGCNEPFLLARASRQLSTEGPFTIVVTTTSDVEASYSLSLQPLSATFNGAPSCASEVDCGEVVQGQFSSIGDTETYRFEASPTEEVRIALDGESCNACWELFDRNGTAVGERACQPFCEVSAVAAVRQLPESGGPFTILVSQYAFAAVSYGMSLQPFAGPTNGAPGCGCGNGVVDRGEDCDQGEATARRPRAARRRVDSKRRRRPVELPLANATRARAVRGAAALARLMQRSRTSHPAPRTTTFAPPTSATERARCVPIP
jgi:hypothetical protein